VLFAISPAAVRAAKDARARFPSWDSGGDPLRLGSPASRSRRK
jgi:hypothetical protein